MSSKKGAPDPRIALSAIREMDLRADRFRRRLREVSMELTSQGKSPALVTPDIVADAVRTVCREMSVQAFPPSDENDTDDENTRAA